jgi:SSS family transporter
MNFLSPQLGYSTLLTFGVVMLLVSWHLSKKRNALTRESFLLANREVGWFSGGISIAASWIWAPALFVSTQIAYEKGLAGAFWFTAPNILALVIFAWLAPKIRTAMPEGYTLPQYIRERFKSERLHKLYLFPYFFYQLMAITVQLFAGGSLVSLLTGISLTTVMPILLFIGLSYTMLAGLKASILTDVVQLAMVMGIMGLILPMTLKAGGGFGNIKDGLAGIEGIESLFDPIVAFSFGIVTSIGLIAGALSDQQYWQRSFAIKRNELKRAFVFGGILFGIVPIMLSLLGFLAVKLNVVLPEGIDASMIGVQTVATLLPQWATALFLVMLLSGLSSTLDSGLSAISSLWLTDVQPTRHVWTARMAMLISGVAGWMVALLAYTIPGFGLQHLWWIFNTIAACVMVPTVLSLYSKRISERGAFYGILVAFFMGIPLFVYANILNNATYIVLASLFVVVVSMGSSLLVRD